MKGITIMRPSAPRAIFGIAVLLAALLASLLLFSPDAHARPRKARKAPANAYQVPPKVFATPAWPHETSDLPPDPAVIYGRLANGFRYVLLKNTEPKDRVAVFLNVQAGSLYEEEGQRGAAHYLEHMLFNGTTHYPPGEMIRYFQSIGMAYGPDVNAHTGFNETVYHVILPDGSETRLDDGLTVIADYAAGALLPPSEIDRERGVILSEKKERDSVTYRTFLEQIGFLMPKTLAAERMPIGVEEVIQKADQALLKGFYDQWYRPEKMVVIMVGDFDPEAAKVLIKKQFEGISARSAALPEPYVGRVHHLGDKFFHHYEKEAGNTEIVIEAMDQKPARPDSLSLQTEYLLRDMADTVVFNRLAALKEEPGCPFTAAYATSGVFLNTVSFSNVTAKASPENWKKALFLIDETLRRALKFGFSEDEAERVRKDYLTRLEAEVLKAGTRNSTALAGEIIDELNDDKVFLAASDKMRLFAPVIQGATPKMLWEAYKKSWSPKNRLVQVTGNTPLPRGSKDVRTAYLAAKRRRVARPKKEVKPVFPFLPDPAAPCAVVEREDLADIGVTRVLLENGVRVNLKPTDFKANEIIFTLRFGSGRADCPEDKPGLGTLAASVINDSGVGDLSGEDLKKALAGKNVSLSFSVNEDDFSFQGSAIPKDLETAFQLLYAQIAAPAFSEKSYDRAQERFDQTYIALAHKTDGALQLSGLRFLAGGDERFGLPDREVFMGLTLDDVKHWIAPALASEPLELSVVGDFDPETVLTLARRFLGNLPARPGLPGPARSRALTFPKGGEHVVMVDTSIETGLCMVAYPTSDVWEIGRTRRLNILGDIFTDRIRERIREKMGATYSPGAWNMASRAYKDYGYLSAIVRVDGEKARQMAEEVKAIAEELRKDGVTEDELQRAVAPSVTEVKETLRTNAYWLGTVLSGSSRHPEQIAWSRTILTDYESISAQEISGMAASWLVNDQSAMILVIPDPNQAGKALASPKKPTKKSVKKPARKSVKKSAKKSKKAKARKRPRRR